MKFIRCPPAWFQNKKTLQHFLKNVTEAIKQVPLEILGNLTEVFTAKSRSL